MSFLDSLFEHQEEEDSGLKLTLGLYKGKCGTCVNWTGNRNQSYLGIGTRYVTIYEESARCAINGYGGSNNYHYSCHCRENNYTPCANLRS